MNKRPVIALLSSDNIRSLNNDRINVLSLITIILFSIENKIGIDFGTLLSRHNFNEITKINGLYKSNPQIKIQFKQINIFTVITFS